GGRAGARRAPAATGDTSTRPEHDETHFVWYGIWKYAANSLGNRALGGSRRGRVGSGTPSRDPAAARAGLASGVGGRGGLRVLGSLEPREFRRAPAALRALGRPAPRLPTAVRDRGALRPVSDAAGIHGRPDAGRRPLPDRDGTRSSVHLDRGGPGLDGLGRARRDRPPLQLSPPGERRRALGGLREAGMDLRGPPGSHLHRRNRPSQPRPEQPRLPRGVPLPIASAACRAPSPSRSPFSRASSRSDPESRLLPSRPSSIGRGSPRGSARRPWRRGAPTDRPPGAQTRGSPSAGARRASMADR